MRKLIALKSHAFKVESFTVFTVEIFCFQVKAVKSSNEVQVTKTYAVPSRTKLDVKCCYAAVCPYVAFLRAGYQSGQGRP